MRAEGVLTQVQGDLDTGFTVGEMIDILRSGEAFVAIHTTANELFRTGAVRGNFEVAPDPARNRFLRADCDGNGELEAVTDAIFQLGFQFLGGEEPPCLAACDANGDGQLAGVSDAVYVLGFQFLGGPPPAQPFPRCHRALTASDAALGCNVETESCRR